MPIKSFAEKWDIYFIKLQSSFTVLAIFTIACLLSGCASNRTEGNLVASWYGEPFHGNQTASGEIYDMHGYTAAHKTADFGTIMLVQNPENGRSVRVTVTDRGPFVHGRDLDLSLGAAKKLDMLDEGVIPVYVQVVGYDERYATYIKDGEVPPVAEGKSQSANPILQQGGYTSTGTYTIQVGSFRQSDNANRLKGDLERSYSPVRIEQAAVQGVTYYRVKVGSFASPSDADSTVQALLARGISGKVVSE